MKRRAARLYSGIRPERSRQGSAEEPLHTRSSNSNLQENILLYTNFRNKGSNQFNYYLNYQREGFIRYQIPLLVTYELIAILLLLITLTSSINTAQRRLTTIISAIKPRRVSSYVTIYIVLILLRLANNIRLLVLSRTVLLIFLNTTATKPPLLILTTKALTVSGTTVVQLNSLSTLLLSLIRYLYQL